MIEHRVRVRASSEALPRSTELAWRIAELAADPVALDDEVATMAVNRIIDNAAAAAAALTHRPVITARAQARCYPSSRGATVFGTATSARFTPEWAAWANSVAVRELDFHDTFLAAEFSHPGDNISALVAVAQHCASDGPSLLRAIACAYEVQIALARSMSLHTHKIDHVGHLAPSITAGLGALLAQPPAVTYQALQQTLHCSTATRQVRKGEISSWKAYAPAFVAKTAIEAMDRAMRGETSPSPIYEGEDGIIAWMLDGPDAEYTVSLPGPGEAKRAILESYTKEHAAAYHTQALIDLALRLRPRIPDRSVVGEIVIHTNDYSHTVTGSGSNDPQKYDPEASRETLDHSGLFIFAVALEDGGWHHERSYAPEHVHRPETVALWRKIRTVADPEWTRRFLSTDNPDVAYGGRAVVTLDDGTLVEEELAVADAHPLGAHPFDRPQYIAKFGALAQGLVPEDEQAAFVALACRLGELGPGELGGLSFSLRPGADLGEPQPPGLLG